MAKHRRDMKFNPDVPSDVERFNKIVRKYIQDNSDGLLRVTTVAGVCVALGLRAKKSFWEYAQRPAFAAVCAEFNLVIENQLVGQAVINRSKGAEFILRCRKDDDYQDIQRIETKAIPIVIESEDLEA